MGVDLNHICLALTIAGPVGRQERAGCRPRVWFVADAFSSWDRRGKLRVTCTARGALANVLSKLPIDTRIVAVGSLALDDRTTPPRPLILMREMHLVDQPTYDDFDDAGTVPRGYLPPDAED